jgi:hypothetical protein
MRARDSKHKADELAAVVRWLRARADGWLDDATALERLERPSLAPTVSRWRAEAVALREAADALERGEHHAP